MRVKIPGRSGAPEAAGGEPDEVVPASGGAEGDGASAGGVAGTVPVWDGSGGFGVGDGGLLGGILPAV